MVLFQTNHESFEKLCSSLTARGVISKAFISSVEKGVREQLQAGGPLAGLMVRPLITFHECYSSVSPVD